MSGDRSGMLGGGESLRLAAVFRSIVAPILLKIEGLASWSNDFFVFNM
jgi:hypothetical protein